MSRAGKRLCVAETATAPEERPAFRRWHRIIQRVGQTYEEALAEYGPDRIGADDGIIVRIIVLPKPEFDTDDAPGGNTRARA